MLRTSYAQSCRLLEEYGAVNQGEVPPLPRATPRHDDEVLGVNFFRTSVESARLENLSIPRTFFCRCELRDVSFAGSDLSESNLCWNDFIGVSFRSCVLSRSDLRASFYEKCDFSNCDLSGADLRRASFKNCAFAGTIFDGAFLPERLKRECQFSSEQIAKALWTEDEGAEPEGG